MTPLQLRIQDILATPDHEFPAARALVEYDALLDDPAVLAAVHAMAPHYPISPSQIEQFVQCPRKWAVRYIDGCQTTTSYLIEGTTLHTYLEEWLLHGTPPPHQHADGTENRMGVLASKGLVHLPKPGEAKVEGRFQFQRGPLRYAGVIDFRQRRLIGDHKSCARFEYMKTPDVLATDPQAMTYAGYHFDQHPEDGEVDLQWTYFSKSEMAAQPVVLTVTQTHAREQLVHLDLIARRIILTRLLYTGFGVANDVPKRPSNCRGVGIRCWNAPKCELHRAAVSPRNQLVTLRRGRPEERSA